MLFVKFLKYELEDKYFQSLMYLLENYLAPGTPYVSLRGDGRPNHRSSEKPFSINTIQASPQQWKEAALQY